MGTKWFNALYQQRPSAQEGGDIKRAWIKYYRKADLPVRFDEEIQSWDATFKDTAKSDYVVGQAWGRKAADCYLLHQVRDRMDIITTMEQILKMSIRFPNTFAKYVEDKANGPAIITMLQSKISGMIPVEPEGGKPARLVSVAPMFEGGNVYFPHPDEAPWVTDLVEELVTFGSAANDDQVDATSQALSKLRQDLGGSFTEDLIPDRIKSIASGALGRF